MDIKTLYAKLATVPSPIRIHLGTEETIDALEKIENQFHLPNGSLGSAKLLQKLQIKDISAEYFAGELAAELKLEKGTALLISEEIKKSILAPIKKDFADYGIDIDLLEKFQIPTPKIVQEIKRPQPMPMPVSSMAAMPIPKPVSIPAPSPAPQPMKSASDAGWSKQSPQNPVVKLGVITPNIPSPTPATSLKPIAPQQPAPQTAKGMSEFERLDIAKRGNGPQAPMQKPPAPTVPTKPQEPAPMMLHEVMPSATQSSPNFRFNQGSQNQINSGASQKTMPTKPAVIEFGTRTPITPSTSTPTSPGSQSIPQSQPARYNEYKAPNSAPTSPMNTGPRQFTQITQSNVVPAAPAQRQPAPPPMPPKPPAQQPQEKVIVQNFLDPQGH